jgi:chorismate synthase
MLRFLTAGESHGSCLTAIIEGLPAGLALPEEAINHELARRQKGYGRGGRMKIERDRAEILSGVIHGQTTGAPVALRIENRDWANWKDKDWPALTVPRPGHADLAGALKYGLKDVRPILERASARETAARVAVGAVAKLLLAEFGVRLGSLIVEIGGVTAAISEETPWAELFALAEASDVHCPDAQAAEAMRQRIDQARAAGDSLGGVFLLAAEGAPVGLGSHVQWDRRLDARLAAAVMSIQAIKGVEIGAAFENARRPGTRVHDEIFLDEGRIVRHTNRAGGIEGGISNGEPIWMRAAMKPIPTTLTPLRTIDLATGQPSATQYQRSDVCAAPAACIVGEAMMAWVLAEALVDKLGGDSLAEMQRCDHRRGAHG